MRTHLLRSAIVTLMIVSLSGCYSAGKWRAPKLAFWKKAPAFTPPTTPPPAATPQMPSQIAGTPMPGPGAGYVGATPQGAVPQTATTTSSPGYPGMPTSYSAPTSYPTTQQPYGASSSTGANSAAGSGSYVAPQKGYYDSMAPAASGSSYRNTPSYSSAPSYRAPSGYTGSTPAPRYGSQAPAAGVSNPMRAGQPYGSGSYPSTTQAYGSGSPARYESNSTPSYGTPSRYDSGAASRYESSTPSAVQGGTTAPRYGSGSASGYTGGSYGSAAPAGNIPNAGAGGRYSTPSQAAAPSYGTPYTRPETTTMPQGGVSTGGASASGYGTMPAGLNTKSSYGAGQTGYQPGNTTDYKPGNTGYNPPGVRPYSSPAPPYSTPGATTAPRATDPNNPPPYLPGSAKQYNPQAPPETDPFAKSGCCPSDGSQVSPANYSQPVGGGYR